MKVGGRNFLIIDNERTFECEFLLAKKEGESEKAELPNLIIKKTGFLSLLLDLLYNNKTNTQ